MLNRYTYSLQYLKSYLEQKTTEETIGIQIAKVKVKVFLFAHEIIVYISDPKNSTGELLELINTSSKVV